MGCIRKLTHSGKRKQNINQVNDGIKSQQFMKIFGIRPIQMSSVVNEAPGTFLDFYAS